MSLRTTPLIIFLSTVALLIAGFVISERTSAQRRIAAGKPFPAVTDSIKAPAVPAATPLLVENFEYAAGSALTANGWSAHSGAGTNPVATSTPGLTMSGYAGSNIGNSVGLATSGEDVNKTFTAVSSGTIYTAFLVNVTDASTAPLNGAYFFHLSLNPQNTSYYLGRVFVKKDSSNNVSFGVSKGSVATGSEPPWTSASYSLNTTYLVVLKYTVVDGTANDTVSLTVSPTTPSSEPTATLNATDNTATDPPSGIGSVALRQGSSGTAPTVRVDGIRVSSTWESAVLDQSGSSPKPILDFNGDGKTDYAVTRDSGGNKIWYTALNGPGTFSGIQWGLTGGDQETPADFDGDGRADVAVWRSAASGQAAYYILRSSDSTVQTELFGQTGDDPSVTADYDGDGKADPAVFRCPTGSAGQCYFYYRGSNNNAARNITFVPWGYGVNQSTIRPVAGDYDGDGKYDFCVFVDGGSGAGQYILLKSSNFGVEYVSWGLTSDIVIPRGDFDGDGKTDFAVTRLNGSNYNTYTLTRTGGGTGASPYFFGVFGDEGTLGDYDGDGKSDIAVWRASNGTFYILNSSNSTMTTYPWGVSGDTAIANWIFPAGQ